jgi:SAM-dependent methyltransferase
MGIASPPIPSALRPKAELFLISLLILFLELACIRWFPAHVLFLTFFTNTVLLACFLGMSAGCLAAGHKRNYLEWTPALLGLALACAYGIEMMMANLGRYVDVGHQSSPQLVYFGAEYHTRDVAQFAIPIEAVLGFFFIVIALAFVGPGQELGRSLTRVPNRVQAYTINILGSVVGIALFAAFSWLQLSPFWWFLPVVLGLGYYLVPRPLASRPRSEWLPRFLLLAVVLLAAGYRSGVHTQLGGTFAPEWVVQALDRVAPGTYRPDAPKVEFAWSPYYRIDYDMPPSRSVAVNQIGHQQMKSRDDKDTAAYALPYLLNRDAGRTPFGEVLIIGAGSGNDLSRALQWGAGHIDAVDIDPVIPELGKRDHPDQPYQDPRVTLHLDDGRNFLRSSDKQYDLVVYALVDSLVLQSSYSNIRLESYLFTREAFADVKRVLKPGGTFVVYNYFRQGWIVARLHQGLEEVFGKDNPLALTLPYEPENKVIDPDRPMDYGGYTLFFAGDTARLREAFARAPDHEYHLRADEAPSPDRTPDGFSRYPAEGETTPCRVFGLVEIGPPQEPLRTATDDWPFLYLRNPMVPNLSLRGMAVMAVLAVLMLALFVPWRQTLEPGRNATVLGLLKQASTARLGTEGLMFFLGAGFMLVETKAVVHMALLFGSTWMVNSVVFFAVLVMILLANLFVLKVRPQRLWPFYAGLLLSLALNVVVPLDFFLGLPRAAQVAGSCLLVFAPILFAGVIFATAFSRTDRPDRAFGANIAGAMLGGLAENTSMLLGFQYLVLVALAFYGLSAVGAALARRQRKEADTPASGAAVQNALTV